MDFIRKIKKLSLITASLAAIIGVMFIAFPAQCIKFASLFLGIALIIIGGSAIINYFRKEVGTFILVLGIIVSVTGIVVCVKYQAIISMLVVIFGIFMLTTGIFNLITSIKAIAIKPISGWFTVLLSVLTVIFGIIAMFKSSELTVSIVRFIGVALISYCVLGVVSYFQVKDLTDKVKETVERATIELPNGDIRSDATIVDEQDESQDD